MKLVINSNEGTVVGSSTDMGFTPSAGFTTVIRPADFDMANASDWAYSNGALTLDPALALNRAKASRVTKIKAEAFELIAKTDWKLARAKEREITGWGTAVQSAEVLKEREAIRQASTAAENAVAALTSIASIQAFTWAPSSAFTPPAVVAATKMTKRAFQNRFPVAANGVSTKFDLVTMFLANDDYAASLGMSGAPLIELRKLIETGVNRLESSPCVDYGVADAAMFTGLLAQATIPTEFRLTAGERTKMLTDPIAALEEYKG